MCLQCGGLIKAIDAYIAKAEDDLTSRLKKEGYAKSKKTVEAMKSIEDEVTDLLLEETAVFTQATGQALDLQEFAEKLWPEIKLTDALAAALERVFADRLAELMPDLIEAYLQMTDRELKLEQVSKRTTAWVKDWSGELGKRMQLTSHAQVEKILTDGLERGDGIAEFTQALLDSGVRNEHYRARTVSVTEVLRAHSVAQQEAFMQSPVVTQKLWRHTGARHNKPRENHVRMDGTVVDKEKPFELIGADGGVYHPMYPRDPNLPAGETANCHCIDEPVVSEEIMGLSLAERQALQQQAIAAMDDEWEAALDAENRAKAGIEVES